MALASSNVGVGGKARGKAKNRCPLRVIEERLQLVHEGEMQTHLASAAKIACSMVNRVVARVPIPSTLNFLHACRPSHVEGTFTHSLDISKSGCSRWQRLDIPVINMLESCSCVVP